MKLNCDLGESFGDWRMGLDDEVMPHIHMANIACGFHASDPKHMEVTVKLALQHGVTMGAHPGYPDLMGFGRRSMQCTADEIRGLLLYQISALAGIAAVHGGRLCYVKPHGALYNDMMRNETLLRTILETLAAYPAPLTLVIQATADNQARQALADAYGVPLWFEAFADRAYDDSGLLVSRQQPGAVLDDPEQILARAERLATQGELESLAGHILQLQPDTLCVHGDNPAAVALARDIRQVLDAVPG
ncbi:5-oxoprolinase subunit PxpA [Pontibacter sp. JAM-7]|uniref:5-oxoprolinase subunit PxpA n=1 Tax=Pontibacter sp. JAM-7 TaxID=3366581 RepID=UPI003AF63571